MSGRRTVIAGGTVATDYGVMSADVLIEDGRVAAIGDAAGWNGADEVIDAAGLVVMPGAIDMHAHFEDPGHTEREDFTTGTMSAAAGGMTTVMEHPLTYPPVTTRELYVEKREMAVVFFVDPELAKDSEQDGLTSITLSYTMYPVRQPEPPRAERAPTPGRS